MRRAYMAYRHKRKRANRKVDPLLHISNATDRATNLASDQGIALTGRDGGI